MFELKVTLKDVVRAGWTALAVFVAAFVVGAAPIAQKLVDTCQSAAGCDWSTAKTATIALALSAVSAAIVFLKNAVLRDGTTLKG